ncbi:DNA primase [Allofustis seminis]|uniref:DNA primase n=1 Tax=Allofustis seminis TaxID=166939 RepID=UPI00037119EE|nr:DNA primase [Allofustis seminis]
MARIPEETIEEIRTQADIIDLISQYVSLKKAGNNHLAHCPFHEDNTPSFSVSEDKQLFHCFSCGRGGTIFTFLQEIEGITFPEAVIKVAEMIHYPIDQSLAGQIKNRSSESSVESQLLKMYEDAAEFYHHILLHTDQGKAAYDYLISRGLQPETIETFKLGFSPTQRNALHLYLSEKDSERTESNLFQESGLFSDYHVENRNDYLDRFSERIIFPIYNERGQVIAFSGRAFLEQEQESRSIAKYMNSPETLLFKKSQVLFNIHQARSSIRTHGEAILFEGYMDVISAWQAGVQNGVATMGTSLSTAHLQLLDRYTDHLILAFDGDQPGMNATNKTIKEITEKTHFTVETVNFPPGDDPDEFIKKYGDQKFRDLLHHGRETILNFYMNYYRLGKNLANESEQLEYIKRILSEVARMNSPIEKDFALNKLADEFQVSFDSLEQQYQLIKSHVQSEQLDEIRKKRTELTQDKFNEPKRHEGVKVPKLSVVERAEQMLLHRLMNSDHAWDVIQQLNPQFTFMHEKYQLLYILYQSFRSDSPDKSISTFLDLLSDNELKNITTQIMWMNLGMNFTEEEIADYMQIIEKVSPIRQKLEMKRKELDEAKRIGNQEAVTSLALEIIQLNKKLKNQS